MRILASPDRLIRDNIVDSRLSKRIQNQPSLQTLIMLIPRQPLAVPHIGIRGVFIFAASLCSLSAQTNWNQAISPGAPLPSDITLTSVTGGANQFELTTGAGGSLVRIRSLQAGNKDVMPSGTSIMEPNFHWGLTAGTALDDGDPATDDRFHLRQTGGSGQRLAPVMQVERDFASGRVDVHAVARDQWSPHLRAAVASQASHFTRYETLADGSIKVRRIIRFCEASVNGAPLDVSAPYFEETLPFHAGNFNRLAERLTSTGSPRDVYTQGSNIPQDAATDVSSTNGYVVIYNNANAFNATVVGVVFGKTQTAAPNQMIVNYSDDSTRVSVRPGIRLFDAHPGAILDFTYHLVPGYALNATFASRINTLVAATPAPVVYPPGHDFTGELAAIVQRLNDNLSLTGTRTDRLGHDVTPLPVTARPMLLSGPEDDADIRDRLAVFPQNPESLLQHYLYGTEAQKQTATHYFFRYPGNGDGNGLRTNYNTITGRHMMWDLFRYDVALGLGYATQAQKDLMLSLAVSFVNAKFSYLTAEGAGGGNLRLEEYIAMGLAGLNFPEHPDAQFWLSRSITNVKKIVDTYFPDGAGTESPRYHDWSLELLARYLRVIHRRVGIDLYDEPGIRSALEWLIRFSSPPVSLTSNKSVTPAWGDSTYSSNGGSHYFYDLSLFAPYYQERDPDFSARLMEWWTRNGRPRNLYSSGSGNFTNIFLLDPRLPVAPVRPNTSTYSPRIGHATLRSGSGDNDEFFASFKCGTQGPAHQDGDIGHIDLFAFGVPLALDSTSGPYDTAGAFNPGNAAHNTVRFNGTGAWDSVSGSFTAFGTSPVADYAVGNTKYGTVSNRHLVMMKGDYLVVWDETTASSYADWFFHFPGSATLDWQDHKVVSSTPWGVNLDVHFLLPAEPLVEPTFSGSFIPTGDTTALRNQLASQATDPGAPGMFTMMGENRFGDGSTSRNPFPFQWLKYISVRNGPTGAGDFLTVMHPRKVGVTQEITTELVSSSSTAVTLRVTCNGRVDTIALTSTGATITKGNEPPVQFTRSWPQSGVSGAAGYVKADFHTAPVTTLTNHITTTGPVEVHTGELALGASERISDSATLMVKPGAAFNTSTFNETVGTLIMNGGVLKGSGTLTASSIEWWGGIVNAPVNATGDFVKKGGVDWSRPANLTYSGDTVIESGNLAFRAGTPALPGTGRVVLRDGAGLKLDGVSATITSLDVTGSANLTTGADELSITGDLTGTGVLASLGNLDLSAINSIAGTLTLQSNGLLTLPPGELTVRRLILNGITLPAGIAVSAATHPGQIAGTGTIAPLEDIPVPTGLSGTATLGNIALIWNPVPGVPGYVVRRATTLGGPYTDIGTAESAAFNDTLVTDGVTYHYVVAASDATGSSADSIEITIAAIGPWYFDPNGSAAGSVANGGSYNWVSNSWTRTPGGNATTEASGPLRHVRFAATSPGPPLAYSVTVDSTFSGAGHGFHSMRVTQGTVTFTGTPGNFYFTQPPTITADAGATIRFAQTGSLAFNLNNQNVTFEGAGTSLVGNDTVIMNNGSITKSGTGTLVLAAPNTYSGNTTISGGTLRLATTDLPALWLDATKASSLALADGAASQWNDANGRGTFVSQATASQRPAPVNDSSLGGPASSLLDFGPFLAAPGRWMQMGAGMTDIRALFWVGKTSNDNFLLGSTATDYHFHSGGAGLPVWSTQYAHANVRNGTTWLNGSAVPGTTTRMPSGLVRVAAFTTGNVNANTLGRDRAIRYGGQQIGEVMVFNSSLSTQQQAAIDAYLGKKWFNTGSGIGNRLPTHTTVLLSNGSTLDLTGINFQTIAALEANDNSGTRVDLGAAELTIGGAASSSFDGEITGSGTLRKTGGGAFVLLGNSSYGGPTVVEGGTLVIEGSLSSDVTVRGGASVVNNGTIHGDLFIESGGNYFGDGLLTGAITTPPPLVTIISPVADGIGVPGLETTIRVTASIGFNTHFGTPETTWTQVAGPGTATFGNPADADTTATFSAAGTYTLRCTATVNVDGQTLAGWAERRILADPQLTIAGSATFREGENSYTHAATFIRGDSATWNSGGRDQLLIGRFNNQPMRGLFAFDLTEIPAGATITSAAFDLWIPQIGTGTVGLVELRPLLRDFVEGTGSSSSSASSGAGTGADWNSRTGPTTANLWATPGGQSGTDFSPTVLGSLNGFDAADTVVGSRLGLTINPAFLTEANAALTESRPLRLMLTMSGDTSGGNRFARFASDDHATIAQRPRLSIGYSLATPTVPTLSPGPAPAATRGQAAPLAGTVSNASGGSLWSLVSGPGNADFTDATDPDTQVIFSASGDYILKLSAANAHGETIGYLAITAAPDAAFFDDWQSIHWPGERAEAIIGTTADPDSDTLPNLMEWALHLDPKQSSRFVPVMNIGSDLLQFTYTRRKLAVGQASFHVEWSDDLAIDGWSENNVISSAPVSIDTTRELVTCSIPLGPENRRFIRLRVQSQSTP
jgi:autotransporter-associated beta strand protein